MRRKASLGKAGSAYVAGIRRAYAFGGKASEADTNPYKRGDMRQSWEDGRRAARTQREKRTVAIMDHLQGLQRQIKRHLWVPEDAIHFTPQVLRQAFGDARALFGVGTINSRPAYWLFAGDSSWECGLDPRATDDAPYIAEYIDDVLSALELEFGSADRACPCECGEYEWSGGRYRCPRTGKFLAESDINYPAVNYGGGCYWFRADWPDAIGLPLEVHPYDGRTKILARSPWLGADQPTVSAQDQVVEGSGHE